MIKREITDELSKASSEYPVVTIFGPRQSGKTTLAQKNFPKKKYHSLEDPDMRLTSQQDPRGFLGGLPDGAILDEIQRVPELLSYIQGIVDTKRSPGQFILTGSHQPELHQAVSQSLAGRSAILTLLPFSMQELRKYKHFSDPFELIVKGAFPRLHQENLEPERFFNSYVQTYIERDVRQMINLKDLRRFQMFLTLLAGRVGQLINYTSLSNDVGVSSTTIKDWISVLIASFVVFELPPYFENISKRLVKSPKLYFTDTGLAAHLAGIRSTEQATRDPIRGGLYENMIILEIMKQRLNHGKKPDLFFYRDTHGNEVDLLILKGRTLIPVEIKSSSTFNDEFHKGIENFNTVAGNKSSPGMVLYNGERSFSFHETNVFNLLLHPEKISSEL
ncbi:MAG: AAA family ATPase [Lentisphaerae bacterium GWF2_49_21]|nr:MAG: AAA family ATPase [Lentisphaerae bacterium GWF2_49_21]